MLVFLILAVVAAPMATFAAPTNAKIRAKKAEVETAQATLADLNDEAEARTEAFNAVTEQLGETRVLVAETRAQLEQADAQLAADRRQLDTRAVGIYKDGGASMLGVILGTASFTDFLSRLDWMSRVGRHDADLVSAVERQRARVDAVRRRLESREAEQAALKADAERKRNDVLASYASQNAYVKSLNAEVAKLIAEERERERKLAVERARRAREAAAKREAAARAAREAAARRTASAPHDEIPTGVGHPEVVSVALQYLGVPYVWGGTTPSGFDCSGLAQYSYAQLGIRIPRTSRQQFQAGTHISPSRLDLLVPGDLVFFGTNGDPGRVHHVGIYSGDGQFVEAPQAGDVVKVSSLIDRIGRRHDYVGASRF